MIPKDVIRQILSTAGDTEYNRVGDFSHVFHSVIYKGELYDFANIKLQDGIVEFGKIKTVIHRFAIRVTLEPLTE